MEPLEQMLSRPLKALIVEDDLAIRLVLQAFMQSLGHTVVMAQDGQSGVDQFKVHKPDLVLMDVIMPVMDGVEATRALRARLR